MNDDKSQDNLLIYKDLKMNNFYMLKAKKDFYVGETILDLNDAETFFKPNYTTIDLLDNHVYHPLGRYINHSCNPNCYVDIKNKKIVAQKIINKNDEITFDYLSTEREIVAPFDCNCGYKNCIGRVEK